MIWIIVFIIISIIYWLICRYFTYYYYDGEWRSFKMYHFILGVLLSTIPIFNVAVFIFISLTLFYLTLCGDIRPKKKIDNFFIRFLNKEL